MAVLATYTQQPADRLDYDVYYASAPDGTADWLDTGDSIASVTSAVDVVGLTVTHVLTSPRVKLWVSGGVAGVAYKITVTVTTTLGRIKQDEMKIRVKD